VKKKYFFFRISFSKKHGVTLKFIPQPMSK